jgi:hypothetical protein
MPERELVMLRSLGRRGMGGGTSEEEVAAVGRDVASDDGGRIMTMGAAVVSVRRVRRRVLMERVAGERCMVGWLA